MVAPVPAGDTADVGSVVRCERRGPDAKDEEMRAVGQLETILMVDDDPFILTATAQLLRSSGYDVQTCEQWMGVASVVRESEPDIILMDYNMPGLKGDELCRILKRNAVGSDMRIVIFSSEPESDLKRIVDESGADGYIRKNAPGHVLLESLDVHLGHVAVA